MKKINETYPKEVQEVLDIFTVPRNTNEDTMNNIVQFIQTTKKKDMFPMLMFHTEEK